MVKTRSGQNLHYNKSLRSTNQTQAHLQLLENRNVSSGGKSSVSYWTPEDTFYCVVDCLQEISWGSSPPGVHPWYILLPPWIRAALCDKQDGKEESVTSTWIHKSPVASALLCWNARVEGSQPLCSRNTQAVVGKDPCGEKHRLAAKSRHQFPIPVKESSWKQVL